MTKKSLGRQQRDAAAKAQEIASKAAEQKRTEMLNEIKSGNNTCWNDLLGIHRDCQALLFKHVNLGRELNDKELIAEVEDKKMLVLKIQSLANDLRQMTAELAEIFAQHKDNVGGVSDPDLLMTTYAIFEQYNLFQERHDQNIMPTVYHILEQINVAEQRLMAKKRAAAQAAAVTDPSVITDVEFKEAVPA